MGSNQPDGVPVVVDPSGVVAVVVVAAAAAAVVVEAEENGFFALDSSEGSVFVY
jgi:hypothetical protein